MEILKSQQVLIKFLEDTCANLGFYDDGSHTVEAKQRMHGGGNIEPDVEKLWPNAFIPITVDCNSFGNDSNDLKTILNAVNEWALKTNFSFEVYLENLNASLIL